VDIDTRQRVDRHGEERARSAVLEVARAMLGEVGYQGLRVEAVAARAGVPRSWLRRWWTTRPLLVAEVLQRMREPSDIAPSGDVHADLRLVFHRTATFLADPLVADAVAGLAADAVRDPLTAERLGALLAGRRAVETAVLLSAAARGDLRQDTDVPLLLDVVFGALLFRLGRGVPPTPAVVDELVDLVLRGQAAPAQQPVDGRPADGQLADGQGPDDRRNGHHSVGVVGAEPFAGADGYGGP
jgi:AcrR family transcriptional regulator